MTHIYIYIYIYIFTLYTYYIFILWSLRLSANFLRGFPHGFCTQALAFGMPREKVLQRCSAARVVPFGYGGCESCPAKAVDAVDIHRFVWFCLPNKFLISQFWFCCSIYIASKMPHSLNRTRLSWMQWLRVFDPNGSVCREKPTFVVSALYWTASAAELWGDFFESAGISSQLLLDCCRLSVEMATKKQSKVDHSMVHTCEEGDVAKTDRKANMSIGVQEDHEKLVLHSMWEFLLLLKQGIAWEALLPPWFSHSSHVPTSCATPCLVLRFPNDLETA